MNWIIENQYKEKFFAFIKQCAILLGIDDANKQAELLDDSSWFFCFDDGLTPEQAVIIYKERCGTLIPDYFSPAKSVKFEL